MSKDAWKRFSDEGYKHYSVVETGFKYNMMDLQAALGIHQLRSVLANWERRGKIWARYLEAFADLPITLPAPVEPWQMATAPCSRASRTMCSAWTTRSTPTQRG